MFNYECDAPFEENEYNENEDNQRWTLPYALLTNRYTPPVNMEAYMRENDLDVEDLPPTLRYARLTNSPPVNLDAYMRENDLDVEDLPPPLIPIRDLFPPATLPTIRSGFDTPNDVAESAPDNTDAVDDGPDADTVIVIHDDDEDVDVGVIEDIIDLVSDEEDDIPHRPSVICWAGRQ